MRIGRNEPCPCGSGKKYKHCHAACPEELRAAAGRGAGEAETASAAPRKLRQCGGCTACCGTAFDLNTPELVLAKGERCPHVSIHGCTLWKRGMPELCQAYLCSYLVEPGPLTTAERPDRVGAIVQRKSAEKTLLAECVPGGMGRLLKNRFWYEFIRRGLCRGACVVVTFVDDTSNPEILYARRAHGRLECELAACREDGSPYLAAAQPVYGRELLRISFEHNRGAVLDADALIGALGQQESIVFTPENPDSRGAPRHFRVTRRQVNLLMELKRMLPPRHSAAPARMATTQDVRGWSRPGSQRDGSLVR